MTGHAQPEQSPNGLRAEYLTAAQVAELLRVSEKTVYRWAAVDPTMPALRIGATLRFPAGRLRKWLDDRTQGQPRIRRQMLSPRKATPPQEARGA